MEEKEKQELIKRLIKENKIKTSSDITAVFNDLQKMMYQSLLNAELEIHVEKEKDNKKNGHSTKNKTLKTPVGEVKVDMPRDRKGTFEPIIVKKRQHIVEDFSRFAILLYSKGNSLEDIQEIIKSSYNIELSKSYISELVSIVSEDIKKWQERSLKPIYVMTYVDCLYCPVKLEKTSEKIAIYVMIGIDIEGKKEVIGIWISDGSESANYWTGIFEEIQERGVKDIIYLSMDGLCGLKEGLSNVYPKTKTQRCIVHLTRNLYYICNKKEVKEVISDYKKIYKSDNIETAKEQYNIFREKYASNKKVIKKVEDNIDHIFNLYSEPEHIRKLIYTTNTIESVNSCLRKVTNNKGMFINKESLIRVLYLRIQDLEKKWSKGIIGWNRILEQIILMYGERITKYLD